MSRSSFGVFFRFPVILGIFAFAVCGQTSAQHKERPLQVDTEEIKVNVSAFDRFGDFVSGVTKDDLVVIEDGRLLQPTSVRRIPANIVIVLDTGGELRQAKNISQTREVAKALVKALDPSNSIAIIEYHDKARILTEWTTNKLRVLDDLDRKLIFGRRSIFSDALNLARGLLADSGVENKQLVLVTDGTDSVWSDKKREAALNRLLSTNINVHVISYTSLEIEAVRERTRGSRKGKPVSAMPEEVAQTLPNGIRDVVTTPKSVTVNTDQRFIRSLKDRRAALEKAEKFLLKLVDDTSGLLILPETKEEMLKKTGLIAKVIDSNYVVTYTPRRPLNKSKPGEVRKIEVSSKKPGLLVLAKRRLVIGSRTVARGQ